MVYVTFSKFTCDFVVFFNIPGVNFLIAIFIVVQQSETRSRV